jgi:beta-galactosidase
MSNPLHRPSRHSRFTRPLALLAAILASPGICPTASAAGMDSIAVGAKFAAPTSPRVVYNFNPGWKFMFDDPSAPVPAGADQVSFDDSKWADVSLPHTWNESDSYRAYISHGGGDQSEKLGVGWYRKHFKLPANADGKKVFLEFDGMRQAGHFFLNGQPIGKYENGVTAVGFDITPFAKFGGQDNVLAVQVDNRTDYKEEATGTTYEWNAKDFNPDFGGLNRDAKLIVMGKVYQTLPLYENLQTTGVYVYPENVDVKNKTTDVTVEAQVRNESGDHADITLSTVVVDADGMVRAKFDGNTSDLVDGESEVLTATGNLANAHLWNLDDPYLYDVYSILSVDGQIVDVCKTQTGFRKVDFKGGAGTGGVWINDHFVWLTGFSQRSADDWPGLGGAYPDWMHDYTAALVRASNSNYIRWMHVSPQRSDVEACDRFGIAIVCPAGDKEKDATGRQWDQRAEVMRDAIIFFRNNPSIVFWEAGNTGVTAEHMKQMVDLRKTFDPHGGRIMGCRSLRDPGAVAATEFFGVMLGAPYSAANRDQGPMIETEDFRDEAARGIWDDFSPPHFGFKPKGGQVIRDPVAGQDTYHWNAETFALAAAGRYANFVQNRIDNPDPNHAKWSAYASIYFTDSDADGRQDGSEVLRVSGKVDGVRLPKTVFYVTRVMQNTQPDIYILGHWTYPAGTKKTMYVAATLCDQVELFLNGKSLGVQKTPCSPVDSTSGRTMAYTGYIYAFPDVAFEPGTLKAVAIKGGQVVAQQELKTAGDPKAIKLTVHSGPQGLQADGSDVVLVDFEVVDADGNRCPTDEARVDFKCDGPAVWRGGFCSDQLDSTNNLYLNTECGINRVAIRSTTTPGTITLTATRNGLTPATVTIPSHATEIKDGLETELPPVYSAVSQPISDVVR